MSLMTLRAAAIGLFGFIVTTLAAGLISANVRKLASEHGWDNGLVHLWDKLPEKFRDLSWERLCRLWWLWLIFGVSGGVALALWLMPLCLVAPNARIALNTALLPDETGASRFEGRPLGFRWDQNVLNIWRKSLEPVVLMVNGFDIIGMNLGDEEVQLNKAYIVSSIDGMVIQLKIGTDSGYVDLNEASLIPPGAAVYLRGFFGGTESNPVPLSQFLDTWSSFAVVIETENQKIRHEFTNAWVTAQIDRFYPDRLPHVTKRKP
jgi:hypothetical protein